MWMFLSSEPETRHNPSGKKIMVMTKLQWPLNASGKISGYLVKYLRKFKRKLSKYGRA
jgi:hypothetical protein